MKGVMMELQPKLIAAADMCEAGEEINLDELAFLLRYASDELEGVGDAVTERDRLLERMRNRLLARCDLLERSERDLARAREGTLEELEALDDELDRELRQRYHDTGGASIIPLEAGSTVNLDKYRSG